MVAFVVIFAALLFGAPSLQAQEVTVSVRVDSNNILIGDLLNLHLEMHHPEGMRISFEAVPDSLAGFEIVRKDTLTRRAAGPPVNMVVETTTWTITSYDSGTFVVPPLKVAYFLPGDSTVHSAESSPIPIFVHGLDVDTSQAIKDIKPPISLGISLAEILPYLIGLVVVCGAGWLIWYYLKKRKKGESFIPVPPPRPADELAIEALRSLESENYWQRGRVKEFHSRLTDIIREYIERRFGVMALEMITDDILDAKEIKSIEPTPAAALKHMLTLADLVKFAKFEPSPEENERSMRASFEFVEATKRDHRVRTQAPAEAEVPA